MSGALAGPRDLVTGGASGIGAATAAVDVVADSVFAESGPPQRALYGSSKGAPLTLTMSMAVDFPPPSAPGNVP